MTGAFNPAGGGITLDFTIGSRFGIGIGAGYLTRGYTQSGAQTASLIDGNLTLELYLGRFVEIAVGG